MEMLVPVPPGQSDQSGTWGRELLGPRAHRAGLVWQQHHGNVEPWVLQTC